MIDISVFEQLFQIILELLELVPDLDVLAADQVELVL